jgi:hypothetical protein
VQARVACYHYVGGVTQQEIANRLGLTRLRVNRIVVQVRSDGLVRIEVKLPLGNCVALEEALNAIISRRPSTPIDREPLHPSDQLWPRRRDATRAEGGSRPTWSWNWR